MTAENRCHPMLYCALLIATATDLRRVSAVLGTLIYLINCKISLSRAAGSEWIYLGMLGRRIWLTLYGFLFEYIPAKWLVMV